MAPFAQERTVALKPRFFVRPAIEPPGSSGSARRPAQPTPDFAQGVAPRENAIAASLALHADASVNGSARVDLGVTTQIYPVCRRHVLLRFLTLSTSFSYGYSVLARCGVFCVEFLAGVPPG